MIRKTGLALAATAGLVASFEGFRTVAYLDPVGIPTACFGRTEGVQLGQRYSDAECEEYLFEEVVKFHYYLKQIQLEIEANHQKTLHYIDQMNHEYPLLLKN